MDWKDKHFHQEMVFQAPRETVLEAARAFAGESLGWQIADTADGFEARGYSAAHQATARFRIAPASGGTKVQVELLVERASPLGFMLFDVGGYYNRQIRKWLEGIQWHVHQRLLSPTQHGVMGQGKPPAPSVNTPAAYIFNGCLLATVCIFALYLLATCVFALIGLVTGHLYLIGRGGNLTIHGPWARAISGLILLFAVFLVSLVARRQMRRSKVRPSGQVREN